MIIKTVQYTEIPDGLDSGMQADIIHNVRAASTAAAGQMKSSVSAIGIYVHVECLTVVGDSVAEMLAVQNLR